MCVLSLQSFLILCDPMDCSPPSSSVHGILQARVLEWVAISSSRAFSQSRGQTCISYISCIGKQILHHCATSEAPIESEELGLVNKILLLWLISEYLARMCFKRTERQIIRKPGLATPNNNFASFLDLSQFSDVETIVCKTDLVQKCKDHLLP